MQIAIVKDNVIEQIGELKDIFPNTSFPQTGYDEDFANEHSILPVEAWTMFNTETEKLIASESYLQDNKVLLYQIVPKTSEEIQDDLLRATASKELEVRTKRNKLLQESDWTQTKDSPDAVDVLWQPYRQALRDITTQQGFPFNVVWPIAP
jgi:hypothetical protein